MIVFCGAQFKRMRCMKYEVGVGERKKVVKGVLLLAKKFENL